MKWTSPYINITYYNWIKNKKKSGYSKSVNKNPVLVVFSLRTSGTVLLTHSTKYLKK